MSGLVVLGLDAGGTHTRAAVADASGRRLGLGRSGPGNASAHGAEPAASAIREAVDAALGAAGLTRAEVDLAMLALSGDVSLLTDALADDLAGVGRVETCPDVSAMFASGTPSPDGGVLLAGTGSVAGIMRDRRMTRSVGGLGWLVGDGGSGFSVGYAVARAVVADLERLGPPTGLTELVLDAIGVPAPRDAEALAARLRAEAPARLARFAPLAIAAASAYEPDPVATRIVRTARDELASLVAALDLPSGQPLVVGGGFVVHGLLANPSSEPDAFAAALASYQVAVAHDGLVGAMVLALDAAGVKVTPELHARLLGASR